MTTISAPTPAPTVNVGDRFCIVIGDGRPPFEVTHVTARRVTAVGLPDGIETGGQDAPSTFESQVRKFPRGMVEAALALTRRNGWIL